MEYSFDAVNSGGRPVSGQISAPNPEEAYRELRERDLLPTRLEPTQAPAGAWSMARGASASERALLLRELATLLGAGVPLAEAIESMCQARQGTALGAELARVFAALRGGTALSVAVRSSKIDFPAYAVQLIAAGELTGALAQALRGAAEQMEYDERVRQDARNALLYPAVLVVSGIVATLIVFLVVVPRFSNLLHNSRVRIPAVSAWVLQAGLLVKENLFWFGLGAAGLALSLAVFLANPAARGRLLDVLARVPWIGVWITDAEIGRWAAVLSTLLGNRVSIVAAMELAESGVRLSAVLARLKLVLRDLRGGSHLADALAVHRCLSPTGLNLIRVGERSGDLPAMLRTLAELYGDTSRQRMKRFLLLLEPLAILLIGGVIGFIMIAVMLAITSLSSVAL